jgi:hypothetical protein
VHADFLSFDRQLPTKCRDVDAGVIPDARILLQAGTISLNFLAVSFNLEFDNVWHLQNIKAWVFFLQLLSLSIYKQNKMLATSIISKLSTEQIRVWPGRSYPLGASWDGAGVNFALFSETADKVELCLFDTANDQKEKHRVLMQWKDDFVFHCFLPDARPGQIYGFRVHGEYDPSKGKSVLHHIATRKIFGSQIFC